MRVVEVETTRPSPFSRSLAFAYVAAYLYEGDAPLAERKAQALTLDRELLRELLGEVELRELLDPAVLHAVESELQSLAPDRKIHSTDALHDLLRRIGDLSVSEIAARSQLDPAPLLEELRRSGRAIELDFPRGETRIVAAEDAAHYRDALGVVLPADLPGVYLDAAPDALEALVARYARSHGPFALDALAVRFRIVTARLAPAVRTLVLTGRLLEGEFRPGGAGLELCDPEVLRRLRRQTLAALRKEIAPVEAGALARFLPAWHGIGGARGGLPRLREAIDALEGLALPFSELEGQLLPVRVAGYQPSLLDELGAAGELVSIGRGAVGSDDGRVALYLRAHVPRLVDPPPAYEGEALHAAVLAQLEQRGATFFAQLQAAAPTTRTQELEGALWDLVWAGQVTNDTFAPLRALSARRRSARGGTARPGSGRLSPTLAGRWSLVRELFPAAVDPTARAHARALMLLGRYGIVMREAVQAEDLPGGFSSVAGVLRAMEEAGRVRRGYFIEGPAGMQFALPGAIARLRGTRPDEGVREPALALSAIDPANPFGLFADWPELEALDGERPSRPRRVAGAIVVLLGTRPVFFLEKGGRKLTIFPAGPDDLANPIARAVEALHVLLARGKRGLRISEINGRPALRSTRAGELERAGFRIEPGGLVLDKLP